MSYWISAAFPVVLPCRTPIRRGELSPTNLRQWVQSHSAVAMDNLGSEAYHSVMCHAAAVVGNSSSGIIEAPSIKVPSCNSGRVDVGYERSKVLNAIRIATSDEFRNSLGTLVNSYANERVQMKRGRQFRLFWKF